MHRIQVIGLLSRKRTWSYYKLYARTQWYGPEEMERFQIAKLRRLLQHCGRHVPFYSKVIQGAGIDVDRVDSLDVLSQFPIIDKGTIKANQEAFTADTAGHTGPLRLVRTGGTTGEPLAFYKDAGLRSSSHAAFYRFLDWMGVSVTDPKIRVWGAAIVGPGWTSSLRDFALRQLTSTAHLDPFAINPKARDDLVSMFAKEHPVLVYGYCQAIYELARWFEEWGLRFPLRAVSTTVEPLFDEYREVFRRVFSCEAFDQYGCGEVEMLAGECEAHRGLHVFPERAICEVDDEERIVLTDLDNHGFPFIRYRNGDTVELGDGPCACGRAGQMIRRIYGRIGDIVTGVNGNRVHPEFFTHLINELGVSDRAKLLKYQVVQDRPDHLEWKLVSQPLSEDDRRRLVAKAQEYLGDMTIDVNRVDDIAPARSGKFQYVVSRI